METETVLAERGSRYGKFEDQAKIIVSLMITLKHFGLEELAPDQQEAIHQIVVKISRILNGDPNYDDNWKDISGYATLIEKRLKGEGI